MTPKDEIARLAAHLMSRGHARALREAIRIAADELGRSPEEWPSEALVRRHAQAMAQQDLGTTGYDALVEARLRAAEEIMTLLEFAAPPGELWLVGRAAQGQVDADPHFRIRYMGVAPIGELARILVAGGCEEPVFEVIQSRWGRLERLRFRQDGIEFSVTRCPPRQVLEPERDLFTGRPAKRLSLADLRKRLAPPPG